MLNVWVLRLAVVLTITGCAHPAARASPVVPSDTPAATVEVALTEFRLAPDPIEIRAGRTAFHVTNVGRGGHDFTILSADGHGRLAHTRLLQPGDATTVIVTLPPATYQVICTLPGHQDLGMQTVIRVT